MLLLSSKVPTRDQLHILRKHCDNDSQTKPCDTHCTVCRWYSAAPNPVDDEPEEQRPISNPRVHQLVDEICQLNLLDVADLTELLRKRLNIAAPHPGAYAMCKCPDIRGPCGRVAHHIMAD